MAPDVRSFFYSIFFLWLSRDLKVETVIDVTFNEIILWYNRALLPSYMLCASTFSNEIWFNRNIVVNENCSDLGFFLGGGGRSYVVEVRRKLARVVISSSSQFIKVSSYRLCFDTFKLKEVDRCHHITSVT